MVSAAKLHSKENHQQQVSTFLQSIIKQKCKQDTVAVDVATSGEKFMKKEIAIQTETDSPRSGHSCRGVWSTARSHLVQSVLLFP